MMREAEAGMFARSLAGHDKGRLYIIMGSEEDLLLLSDGRLRPAEKPKRKKKKHVQIDYGSDEDICRKLRNRQTVYNEEIRKAIKRKEEHVCQR